ncbi:MAG: hypothetical protein ABI388_09450 [Bacteroidia bacterium]
MKKIFSTLVVALTFMSASVIAQNNVTLILKAKVDASYFERVEFTYTISGINNQQDAATLLGKMKANADIASVKNEGKDAEGNYQYNFQMKTAHDKTYYINMITNLGVAYVQTLKGEKKTPQQFLQAKNNVNAK